MQAGSFSVSGSFGNFSEENNVCGYSVESNQVTNHESNTIEDEETNTRAYEILASKQNQKAKVTIEVANI